MYKSIRFFIYLTIIALSFSASASEFTDTTPRIKNSDKRCLLVMSYHKGYEWNDGIEQGVVEKLSGKCHLKIVYMDTKRNTSIEFGKKAALKAKAVIDVFKPDVLIASDDNASRYLVAPYLKNTSLPIIFCGLNWSASEYGYPYKNATGMVEVAPIVPLLKHIQQSLGGVKRGVFISPDVITEHKDALRFKKEYIARGINLNTVFVSTQAQWKKAFLEAQKADFIVLGNKAGINDWDESSIVKFVRENSKTLTTTNYRWMMPYAMLGITKDAQEQGQWAGEVAIAILDGLPVEDIPITINKSWKLYINTDLLKQADIILSNKILNHAHKTW